jgi:hypothetical protein
MDTNIPTELLDLKARFDDFHFVRIFSFIRTRYKSDESK